ncbi:GNAT family N-acetyltransferase [Brachybacterium sp. YJGR34]|uniref:GNAT family N-acetyltransferase n=1 Tax=Brachybacterium sp. YJGR34 TaxID=2059911 RepID=UPI000E0C3232|nr:GNAT family protein [Brachybacterium sp. YJGR34]
MTSTAQRPVAAAQVSLRLLALEDAPVLARLEHENREELLVGAPLREEEWFTAAGQRSMIEQSLADGEEGRGVPLAIWLAQDGAERLVGRLSLSGIVRGAAQSASLGYWVGREVAGRGIATHAVRASLPLAFGALGLHRLQAEVQDGNAASERILTRCGFQEIGLAPAYLHLGGRWVDCRLFQLVDAGWREGTPGPAAAGLSPR